MFEHLSLEVNQFSEAHSSENGRAFLQLYQSAEETKEAVAPEHPPKVKKVAHYVPFLLAVVTPLMARAHKLLYQSSEMVYCDSTASLDNLNTAVSSNHNVVSSWLLLYVFTKAEHKTHEMITQTQKDDSSCFDDVMQLQALPDIAHSGLSAVASDVKKQQTAPSTFASIQYVRNQSPL